MKISAVKATRYLGMLNFFTHVQSTFLITFWVKFGATDMKIMLLSICEFCENLQREGHAFRVRENDVTCTCVPTFFPLSPLQPHCSSIIPSLLRHASIL